MSGQGTGLRILPCLNSSEMASARRRELDIPRDVAAELGRSAVEAAKNGYYLNSTVEKVQWADLVSAACAAKRSIPPEAPFQSVGLGRGPAPVTHQVQGFGSCPFKATARSTTRVRLGGGQKIIAQEGDFVLSHGVYPPILDGRSGYA
jgi:hypothetical protein